MAYSVGNSTVANYANTSSGKVTNVVADNGVGGSGESVNVVDRVALEFIIATTMQYPTINVSAIPGYIAGKSDLTITVNAGVYVYGYIYTPNYDDGSPDTPYSATMNILGGTSGDTIKLVNNGYILGAGGDGGGAIYGEPGFGCCCYYYYSWTVQPSSPGQAAVEITYPLILENNGYIAGGGGGGALALDYGEVWNFSVMGGGGGAGGGIGIDLIGSPAVRAVPPNIGNVGQGHQPVWGPCNCRNSNFFSGGGGGFVLPGVGGLAQSGSSNSVGRGGGSGGAGSAYDRDGLSHVYNNNGGTANGNAPVYTRFPAVMQGGGGGGWGATGGISYLGTNPQNDGSPGGNSIITNGNAITTITAGTQYGALRTTGTTYVQTLSSSATTTTVTIPSGYTNAIIFIPTGVTLRSAVQATAALIVTGALVDNLKIIVNGAVLGKGGNGASESNNPQNGGDAIRIAPFKVNITITIDCTYGYVAAGGGGGGRAIYTVANTYYLYGGGGAGSGNSGEVGTAVNPALGATSVGTSGSNGTTVIDAGLSEYTSGGGGGLIVPGTSVSLGSQTAIGAYPGIGGSGGGTGAARKNSGVSTNFTNNGGGFNQLGGTLPTGANRAAGGGGGGWGAGGGRGVSQFASQQSGGLGGYAVNYGIGGFAIYVINPANVAGQLI